MHSGQKCRSGMQHERAEGGNNSFVGSLSERNRKIFLQRYWCTESVRDIAEKMNMTENSVSAVLKRTRKKLHKYLAERGFVP